MLGAFARAECDVDPSVLTAAHYRAAARFTTDIDVETGWAEVWLGYLQAAAGAAIGVRAGSGSWVRSVSGRDEAGWTSLREVLLGPPVRRRGGIR